MIGKVAILISSIFLVFVFSSTNVFAISSSSGTMELSLGIVFDSRTINPFFDNHIIESWNTSRIASWGTDEGGDFGSFLLANDGSPIYDYSRTPGWNNIPENQTISYGSSTVSNNFDHTNIYNPQVNSSVNFQIINDPYPDGEMYGFTNNSYYSEFKATGSGSFIVFLDYAGSWQGTTTAEGDRLNVYQSVELRVTDIFRNENGFLQYGEQLFGDYMYERLLLEDIDSGIVEDFSGRLEFVVDYVDGDMFSLLFSARNHSQGISIQATVDPDPVPEPATVILLGSGLVGLGLYLRKKKYV